MGLSLQIAGIEIDGLLDVGAVAFEAKQEHAGSAAFEGVAGKVSCGFFSTV